MGKFIISEIVFHGCCGITPAEREVGCRIAVNFSANYNMDIAIGSDNISNAVDYATLTQKLVGVGKAKTYNLVEAMAGRMADMVEDEYPMIESFTIKVEKVLPPVEEIKGSFAVEISRDRSNIKRVDS